MKRLLLLPALALLVLPACKEEEPVQTRSFFDDAPKSTAGAPGQLPQGHPPVAGAAGGMGGGAMGGGAMGGGAMGGGAMGGGAMGGGATAGAPVVSGTITLGEGVTAPRGTLYIIGRSPAPGGGKGAPLLVKRIPAPVFPQKFQLTTGDAMMGGAQVPDEIVIQAHVDQDGDAVSRTPGDVEGEAKGKKGTTDLGLVLDHVVTEGRPGMKMGG